MKLEQDIFKSILNEEGKLDEDKASEFVNKFNEDLQKEVSQTYSKGIEKGKGSLQNTLEESTKKVENEKNQQLSELEKQLSELKNQIDTQTGSQKINDFKTKTKGRLTDEQIENFVNTISPEKLNEINIDAFARKELNEEDTKVKKDNENLGDLSIDKMRSIFNKKKG